MSECVCILTLVIRHTNRIFYAPFRLSVVYLVFYIFSLLSHKLQDFRKANTENEKCIFNFFTTFVRNAFHYDNNSARYDNLHRFSCKVPIILATFQSNLI